MSLARTETLALKVLQAVLSLKDAVDQGCMITADTAHLAAQAEDVLLGLNTHKITPFAVETRPEHLMGLAQ